MTKGNTGVRAHGTAQLAGIRRPVGRASFTWVSSKGDSSMKHNQPTSMPCLRCGGSGRQRGRLHTVACVRCKGRGRLSGDELRPGEVAGL